MTTRLCHTILTNLLSGKIRLLVLYRLSLEGLYKMIGQSSHIKIWEFSPISLSLKIDSFRNADCWSYYFFKLSSKYVCILIKTGFVWNLIRRNFKIRNLKWLWGCSCIRNLAIFRKFLQIIYVYLSINCCETADVLVAMVLLFL